MNPPPSPSDQWHLLQQWDRLRDDQATAEETASFHQRLRDDPAARDWLAQAILLEAELRFDAETLLSPAQTAAAKAPAAPSSFTSTSLRLWRWSHAAAAALAALLTWTAWSTYSARPIVATLIKAQSCKWGNSALPTLEGSALHPGLLDLVEGMATLRFKSGAEVILEAPVSIQVISAMEAYVQRGTVVADVPPQAKGFTIRTPETTVVDYGTRFGLSAGDDGKCLVHVIDGLVEVSRRGEDKVKELRGGQQVDFGGLTRAKIFPDSDPLPAEPGRWLPAPMADLGDGWQVITTAFGQGKDSWIQSNPNHRITGQETYLRVKHTTLAPDLERRSYLAFDLSKVSGRIAQAELVLHLEPSELGYASLVPDATFAVYGLTAEAEDHWAEDSLHWEHAPAHSPLPIHHSQPDPTRSTLLGRFQVPQGRQSGPVSLHSPELVAFLQSDTNQIATLIIRRETNETSRSGLVHAFASKENPRNTPPMLRLRIDPL
jgi:hypothetical protein